MSTPNSGFRLFLFKVTTTLNMTMRGCVRSSLPRGRRSAFPAPTHPNRMAKQSEFCAPLTIASVLCFFHSAAPLSFWAEALNTATYLINRRPCRATGPVTPHHLLLGVPPRYHELRVFGRLCYPKNSATTRHKLSPRSVAFACVFLGYPTALLRHCHRPRLHVTTCDVRGARLPVP
jgi:hypothetical protein